MMVKCPICEKGTLHRGKVTETLFGIELGVFDGEKCNHCKETFLGAQDMKKIESKAKALGIWGLSKKIKIVRSGNSLSIRIPAPLAKYLKLKAGKEVVIHPEGPEKLIVDIV